MAKLEWTPSYFTICYINKSLFTLLSITMKWINLWIKNFADYIYTKLPLIQYNNSFFAQKQKNIRESRKETRF